MLRTLLCVIVSVLMLQTITALELKHGSEFFAESAASLVFTEHHREFKIIIYVSRHDFTVPVALTGGDGGSAVFKQALITSGWAGIQVEVKLSFHGCVCVCVCVCVVDGTSLNSFTLRQPQLKVFGGCAVLHSSADIHFHTHTQTHRYTICTHTPTQIYCMQSHTHTHTQVSRDGAMKTDCWRVLTGETSGRKWMSH